MMKGKYFRKDFFDKMQYDTDQVENAVLRFIFLSQRNVQWK